MLKQRYKFIIFEDNPINHIHMSITKTLFTCILSLAAISLHAQEVTFYTPTTVRVVKQAPDTSKDMNLSLVVIAEPEDVKVAISKKGSVTTYSSSALRVSVDERNGQITFADKAGKVLLREGGWRLRRLAKVRTRGAIR